MIKVFNTNHPSVYISLLVLSALSRLVFFISPALLPKIDVFSLGILGDFRLNNPLISTSLAVLAVTFNAVFFNYILVRQELVSQQTHLPAAVFIIISALIPGFAGRLDMQLYMLSILLSIQLFYSIDGVQKMHRPFFSGLFLGVASLFQPPTLLLYLFFALGLRSLNVSPGRASLVMLLGALFPFYFSWIGFFLDNSGASLVESIFSSVNFSVNIFDVPDRSFMAMGVLAFFGIIFLSHLLRSEAYRITKTRKWIQMLLLFNFGLLLIGILFENGFWYASSISLFTGLAATYFFLGETRKKLRATTFYLLLAFVFVLHAQVSGLIALPIL